MENHLKLKSSRLVVWIIWFALIQSVIMYFVILKMQGGEPTAEAPDPDRTLKPVFLIAGVISLVVSFTIRFVITANKPAIALPSYVVSLALAELSAILGLVLGFSGLPIPELYIFFGMSLLGLLAQPPTIIGKQST